MARRRDPGAPAADRPAAGSGAVLIVDLAAIVANYRLLAREAAAAEVAAVVKADAYGLGAARVAPALAAAGCATFFVALASEGAVLRASLPAATIAVFNGPDDETIGLYRAHGLTPVLNSPRQVALWQARGGGQAAMLHVDTGMARLGLSSAEVSALAAAPGQPGGLTLTHVMSHLAWAEDPAQPLNAVQLERFRAARATLAPVGGAVKASLANSSGIFLGADYHFDLVRPGAALYGIAPRPGGTNPLSQVVHFHARILQVLDVDSPMTVGYGAAHRVVRRGRIATVAAGYADGYLRSLSNQGHAFVGELRVPVVGRVSMDLTTLDVTDVPAEHARPGTMVELIGPRARTDAVAAAAGTIGYELLTRLGPRCERVYREPE